MHLYSISNYNILILQFVVRILYHLLDFHQKEIMLIYPGDYCCRLEYIEIPKKSVPVDTKYIVIQDLLYIRNNDYVKTINNTDRTAYAKVIEINLFMETADSLFFYNPQHNHIMLINGGNWSNYYTGQIGYIGSNNKYDNLKLLAGDNASIRLVFNKK